ncbi:MAG: hypothetical protein R3D90_03440 [Paracoccaceae bacterium]
MRTSLMTAVLTYEVTDAAGNTDVAFLTLNIVACFVAGTRIAVPGARWRWSGCGPGTAC